MKVISFINFFGVLVLAIWCGIQWETNRRLNLTAIDLDKTRQAQAQKITEQAAAIKGYTADLEDFRNRLMLSEDALKKAESQIAILTREQKRLTAERNGVLMDLYEAEATIDDWQTAMKDHDATVKKANDMIVATVKQRDDAVAKFNDLAGKYNDVVKELNEARTKKKD